MSKYDDLREASNRDRYSPPDELYHALDQAADDIKRLWEATVPQYDDCYTTCPVCYGSWFDSGLGEPTQHAPDCPHEALRWLFGEGADHE